MTKRLYPEDWPAFDYEPTEDKFEVIHFSDSCGEGLQTKVKFKTDDLVFRFSGIALPYQTLFTLQANQNLFIHDPFVMGKVLHSCSPNMRCDMETRSFYAEREIEIGELLTMDYETTEDELYRMFECKCGSENCKGTIVGRKYREKLI